ncbi:hypothetical protein BDP27DRAFT_1424282 [Rhodocollybia butyracea]|uniref:Uncharacterized protein n=1 Tax=Rhodocollybia butyracea TaxID=206335 RepID=A0A9P5PQ02_9AGAR|nr:hypothetical protein BDP27DRAFT_1424282 [Rhodocollybia butyracea]
MAITIFGNGIAKYSNSYSNSDHNVIDNHTRVKLKRICNQLLLTDNMAQLVNTTTQSAAMLSSSQTLAAQLAHIPRYSGTFSPFEDESDELPEGEWETTSTGTGDDIAARISRLVDSFFADDPFENPEQSRDSDLSPGGAEVTDTSNCYWGSGSTPLWSTKLYGASHFERRLDPPTFTPKPFQAIHSGHFSGNERLGQPFYPDPAYYYALLHSYIMDRFLRLNQPPMTEDNLRPVFTNPWDQNTLIESRITSGGNLIYSTDAVSRKIAIARERPTTTPRNYFGSDHDEMYRAPVKGPVVAHTTHWRHGCVRAP